MGNEKRMNKEELIDLINSLKIDRSEYWILSSSALMIRGIYDSAGDLDLAVTEKGLKQLMDNYDLKQKENGWYIVNDKVECIVETKEDYKYEVYEDYQLESIDVYYNFLINSDREKDKKRIPLIEEYMNKQKKKVKK